MASLNRENMLTKFDFVSRCQTGRWRFTSPFTHPLAPHGWLPIQKDKPFCGWTLHKDEPFFGGGREERGRFRGRSRPKWRVDRRLVLVCGGSGEDVGGVCEGGIEDGGV